MGAFPLFPALVRWFVVLHRGRHENNFWNEDTPSPRPPMGSRPAPRLAAPMADAPEARKRWWKSEPMDEQGSRTMFVGLIIAFALYGMSFVVTAVYREYAWANWASIALILTSVVFLGVWFLAVRGGFRLGRSKSRATRRAKMHAEKERQKRIRLNR